MPKNDLTINDYEQIERDIEKRNNQLELNFSRSILYLFIKIKNSVIYIDNFVLSLHVFYFLA